MVLAPPHNQIPIPGERLQGGINKIGIRHIKENSSEAFKEKILLFIPLTKSLNVIKTTFTGWVHFIDSEVEFFLKSCTFDDIAFGRSILPPFMKLE